MSEQMKFIVKELNASLGRNYDLIKFDALDEKQLLQVLVDLLANFNAGEKLDIREDDSETVSVRLLEMLASVKYRPPGTLEPARFRAQLLAGDARTIHHVLHWLLTNKEQVKKTAYLAKYLKIPDIPSDVARNNTVQDLLDLYQNLIDEFKDVHKRTRILEKENASEIINDIKEMAVERDIVIKRLENVQVNLVDVHNKEEMLNVGKNLRVQQEKAKELENQYEAQQSQLKTASDQLKRYLNVIHGQSATPKTANDVIKHLMDEIQLNGYLVKEKLPQESSNLQKELNIMQNIATEQHPTRSDLIVVQDKIAAVNSELESLVQRRLASSGPQEDKLAPFRQQAAVIRRNKEASAARAHELAAALKDHEATLADLQSQYETYASCLKTNISLDKNTQSSTKDIFISLESQGIVSVSDGHVELAHPLKEEWRVLGAHYAGPASVALLAALLAAALPLAGLFWCCCYWCRAGRRRRPFDRKYDACLKGLLAILLIALLTLFLFGVVCAFATDSQVESGTRESAGSVRAGLRDAQTFLNATQAHARWLLVNNYRELERRLSAMLTSSGLTISVQLGEFSRAVSVTTLTGMVRRLDGVRDDLRAVRDHTADLRARAERLNAVLRSVKGQLLQTLARCDQPQCVRLQEKHKIGQLDTEIHYSQMPDVTELLNNVTALLDSDIKAEVEDGQRVFREIQLEIQRSVDEHIPSVSVAIAETGRRLEGVADSITYLAGNTSAKLQQHSAAADTLQQLYQQYGPYRRYVGIGAACALLLMTVLLVWGLVCGVCGKRPDVYGASDCCNKGAGSRCLLCGMCVMFVLGGAVALVLAVHFLVGVAAQRFICDPLTEPRDNRLFDDVERFVELERALFNERLDPNFNMTYVLLRCHGNMTLYETFQLHRLYDLEQLKAQMSAEVSRRAAALRPSYPRRAGEPELTILRGSAKRKLAMLAETGLSDFDFDRILDALETNMTSLALDTLAAQLEQTARAVSQRAGFQEVAGSLRNASRRLAAAHTDIVTPMLAGTHALNVTALKLRDGLKFNHSSLKEAISYLMHETSQAETFLNTQGPDLIQNMTREFAEVVAALLEQYLQRVVTAARQDVGRCGPLSHAFNATRDAHCRRILMPTNGYWMSLSWCVVLFVPIMVVAQRLARLYLHVDPYPGPLVEAEYLYDAYADRDNVPLANGSKRSTLDIEGKIAEWRGRGSPSAPPAPPSPSQLLLEGRDVVCQLLPAATAALMDDLKTRLDAKDEDNESGIHEADAYKAEKRAGRDGRRAGRGAESSTSRGSAGGPAAGTGGAGGRGAEAAPVAPPLDAHHARRYNDMAPKHWEEGPPRYHGPTEYERPPPYYYPGPNDRQ